jgi:hypothetical protein
MQEVPNRASNPRRRPQTTRVVITNGQVGSGNSMFADHAIHTGQGMAALGKKVDAFSAQTGLPAWAETYTDAVKMGSSEPRVVYGKKK